MKNEEVVVALQIIAEKGLATGISKEDLKSLKAYNLIDIIEEKEKTSVCALTKKGRVMLKANTKKPNTPE
jgi:hypothetical protein